MTRIVACIVAWNEEESIARTIRSVKAYVDRVILVDAVFHGNALATGDRSDDATVAEATRACGALPLTVLSPGRRVYEDEARNLYLAALAPGDWCLVIDGDETLYGDHAAVLYERGLVQEGYAAVGVGVRHVLVYTTAVLVDGQAPEVTAEAYASAPVICTAGWQPRLFLYREGLEYEERAGERHQVYDRDGGRVGDEPTAQFGLAFTILNDHVRQTHARYLGDYAWETHTKGADHE
jgi:hypothetical protein